jgi:2-polyprenyl-3-methyl-5-hydroxy-6-metoxy-1,4-benzoquinol methylase
MPWDLDAHWVSCLLPRKKWLVIDYGRVEHQFGELVMYSCEICGNNSDNQSYCVREMMYGMGEEFEYTECSNCGCLQLTSLPSDLSKYYPLDYYSFSVRNSNPIESWLERLRYAYIFNKQDSWLGRLLAKKYGVPDFIEWMRQTQTKKSDAVLDIGCGKGALLQQIAKTGFQNLTGIDPYLDRDSITMNGVQILKKHVYEVTNQYDLIIMRHSFEHMPQPSAILQHVYKILRAGSYALIAVPVIGYAWRKYGTNWVALDAPRHLFLHTVASMKLLAEKAGFTVNRVVHNSHAYQFWGSEQIARGIPIRSSLSYAENPSQSIFSQADMHSFARQAQALNRDGDGDSACFYLYKK